MLTAYAAAGAGFLGSGDLRSSLLASSACSMPQRGLLLAESVGVQDIGKVGAVMAVCVFTVWSCNLGIDAILALAQHA